MFRSESRRLATLVAIFVTSGPGGLFAQVPEITRRAAEYDVVVEKNVMIAVRDGTRLAADIYRPGAGRQAGRGAVPDAPDPHALQQGRGREEGRYYAERGYNVVANDVRGRYASEGTWRLIADDPADGYDVVEWIAAQPWSDGKVGTFGTSYPGGTQHALAEMNPPHLTTMIPIDAVSNCGVSGMRHGGAFELRFMNWIFNQGAANSRAALADPALKAALDENGRRIREHVDSLPVRAGQHPAAGRPRVRGVARRGDAERPRVAVLEDQGDVGRRPRRRLRRRPRPARHRLVRLVDAPGHDELRGALEGEEVAAAAGDRPLGPRRPERRTSRARSSSRPTPRSTCSPGGSAGTTAGSRASRTASTTTRRSCSTSWGPATTASRRRAGSSTAAPGAPSANGRSRGPGRPPTTSTATARLATAAPARADEPTTYTFDPRHPVPTIGGNISSNSDLMTNGGYDQRPRDDTHAADEPPAALRAPRRARLPHRAARRGPGSHRHGRRSSSGSPRRPSIPTSPPS